MKKLLLLMTVFTTLIACGKKGNSTNVKLKLSNLVSTGTTSFNGGVYLVGHRLDDFQSIAIGLKLDGTDNFFTLEKGDWEFAAIGWSSTVAGVANTGLSGDVRCGYSGVKKFSFDEEQIELTLSKAGCNFQLPTTGERFSALSDLEADYMFKKVNFYSCMQIPAGGVSGSECYGVNNLNSVINVGLSKSYEIVLPGEMELGGNKSFLPGLKTKCINMATDESVRLPTGNGFDSFINLALVSYPEENCVGNPSISDFRSGLRVNSTMPDKKSFFMASDTFDSSRVALYFEHNPNSANNAQVFGNGQDGSSVITTIDANYFANILSLSSNSVTVTSGHGTNILPNDEVMLYITEDDGTCGSGFGQGRFVFNRIASKSGDTFTFFKSINEVFGTTPNISSSACSVQMLKVFNYKGISLSGSTPIVAAAYDETNKIGGVIAIRVRDNLQMNFDGNGATIDSYAKGFYTISGQSKCSSTLSQCAPFGDGNGTFAGGGAIYLSARSIITDNGSGLHFIKADEGGTGATKGSARVRLNYASIGTNDSIFVNGNPSFSDIRYCNDSSSSLSLRTAVDGTAGDGLIQTPSLCY